MSKAPAFQFYPKDYLSDEDVMMMTLEEEGAYIRAMSHCWLEGSIPADPARLSALLKGASTTVVGVVQRKFKQHPTDSSRLVHPRLDAERKKQEEWREKSRLGGTKSGETRRINSLTMKGGSTNGHAPFQGWHADG